MKNKKYTNWQHTRDIILLCFCLWFLVTVFWPGDPEYVVYWSTSQDECVKVIKIVDGKEYPSDCYDLKNLNIQTYTKIWVK